MIVLPSFLRIDLAERLAAFLHHESEYRPIHGLYSRGLDEVPERDWSAAAADDHFCRFSVLSGVDRRFQCSENLLAYLKLRRAWTDPRFTELFETLLGEPLGPSDFHVHAMRAGDYLRPHRDAVEQRRLAYVLFVTPEWPSCVGGVLTLSTDAGDAYVVPPEYNSLALFDVRAQTEHCVSAIDECAGPRRRITIGGWISERIQPP